MSTLRVTAHGDAEPLAEEIAARFVNKERARHGESVRASASSLNDISSGRRGGPTLTFRSSRTHGDAVAQ
jgi:hypothetical protein